MVWAPFWWCGLPSSPLGVAFFLTKEREQQLILFYVKCQCFSNNEEHMFWIFQNIDVFFTIGKYIFMNS